MGLSSSLRIGASALNASQLAIQTTGNNLANIATPGYNRQTASLAPNRGDSSSGVYIGNGVRLSGVRRQIDTAVLTRLWAGVSDEAATADQYQILSQVESVLNELSGRDLSSEINTFFSTWSEQANLGQSSAIVVQQGEQLAGYIRQIREDLIDQRAQIDRTLGSSVDAAQGILDEVARLNAEITVAEGGSLSANSLRDQRDQLLRELSTFMDVTAHEQSSGSMDVLVGSTPVVLGSRNLGIKLVREIEGNTSSVSVRVGANESELPVTSGKIGALLSGRQGSIDSTLSQIDAMASELIIQVNSLHATSANPKGLTSASSNALFGVEDRTRSLASPLNTSMGGLPRQASNGGFFVRVTNSVTGETRSVRIDVDLDGINAEGAAGHDDDTSITDIANAIGAIEGLSAGINSEGRLQVSGEPGVTFTFSDDSSGVLGLIGVNAYFDGTGSADIAVRADLIEQPALLGVGRWTDGKFVENGTALAIATLMDKPLAGLGNQTVREHWTNTVQRIAVQASGAETRALAAQVVRESIETQHASISGVNADEEAINLMTYQRQYQGAARFVATVDALTDELLAIL